MWQWSADHVLLLCYWKTCFLSHSEVSGRFDQGQLGTAYHLFSNQFRDDCPSLLLKRILTATSCILYVGGVISLVCSALICPKVTRPFVLRWTTSLLSDGKKTDFWELFGTGVCFSHSNVYLFYCIQIKLLIWPINPSYMSLAVGRRGETWPSRAIPANQMQSYLPPKQNLLMTRCQFFIYLFFLCSLFLK